MNKVLTHSFLVLCSLIWILNPQMALAKKSRKPARKEEPPERVERGPEKIDLETPFSATTTLPDHNDSRKKRTCTVTSITYFPKTSQYSIDVKWDEKHSSTGLSLEQFEPGSKETIRLTFLTEHSRLAPYSRSSSSSSVGDAAQYSGEPGPKVGATNVDSTPPNPAAPTAEGTSQVIH